MIKEVNMKGSILLIFAIVLILFITGCQQKSPLVPIDSQNLEDLDEPVDVPIDEVTNKKINTESKCIPSTEKCDGIDNNCDNSIDNGLNICPMGAKCYNGKCVSCPLGKPLPETCDGKDNDCDGLIDEDVRDNCGNCINSNNPYPLNRELCDGKDNDCDGEIDEIEGNECANFVCRTSAKFDLCDKNIEYRCLKAECVSTKICNDPDACYWDWVDETAKFGPEGAKPIRIWAGPEKNIGRKYVCGEFDTRKQQVYSSCEGSGCVANICKGGNQCAEACYIQLKDDLLNLRKCVRYPGINKLCG